MHKGPSKAIEESEWKPQERAQCCNDMLLQKQNPFPTEGVLVLLRQYTLNQLHSLLRAENRVYRRATNGALTF